MQRIRIQDARERAGEEVTVAGFVETIRNQGAIKFLLIRDLSGKIQAVVLAKDNPAAARVADELSLESVVEVTGMMKQEPQAPGGIEITAREISVLSRAAPELPIPILEKGSQEEAEIDKRLDWRWLDLRKPEKTLIFRAATVMEQAFREYWTQNGYIQIHSPKLMSSASESGAEVFEVKYFDRKAYLAQSPQFYKQMAMAAGFERVFEVGPVFRAEPSFTSRHATEFTGFDAEISFIASHQDVIAELERAIQHAIGRVAGQHGAAIKEGYQREVAVPEIPFPQLTMTEAKRILKDLGAASPEADLTPEEERQISKYVLDQQGHELVFITDYPISVRPFYHMRYDDKPGTTKSFDLLWNGIEITTGAQREHRYDVLLRQAKEKGIPPLSIEFYLNFFKYGCPPHGGYGMGPTRMLMKLFNLGNIRDVTFLYRGVKRLEP